MENKPTSGDDKRAHLAMIQGVISRMGGNLFFLKGWAVTLIIGLFAATISFNGNQYLNFILVGALVFFWGFDAYFLSLERCFRNLYDEVRKKNEENIDFSMDISDFKKYYKNTWIGALLSKTLLAFYPVLAVAMLLIIHFLK
ncbi:MAG: hypothetical protein PHX25_03290 [Candidatus Pacebacteria bacterium]|nr:hypothetical protein [Candidatus Paceibacterota bacterium]